MTKAKVYNQARAVGNRLVNGTNGITKKFVPKLVYNISHQYKVLFFIITMVLLFYIIWLLMRSSLYKELESDAEYTFETTLEPFDGTNQAKQNTEGFECMPDGSGGAILTEEQENIDISNINISGSCGDFKNMMAFATIGEVNEMGMKADII